MGLYNMLFGVNGRAPIYLACLGLTMGDVGRFRDCYLENGMIAVYTRNGGGNRECWSEEAGADSEACPCCGCFMNYRVHNLPHYHHDSDDDFDCTYATIYFTYPPEYADMLKALENGEENIVPSEKWAKLLELTNVK